MTTVFERHKITTLSTLVGLGLIFCLIILNALGSSLGLGKVVIYQSHPIYGYRPIPNQTVSRTGAMIKINNLSLRSDKDWEYEQKSSNQIESENLKKNRLLFLGDSVTYGGSYIDNKDIFSSLITQHLPSHIVTGNAAANGWGVLNVTGLVVDYGFLPASTYVSVFTEQDFYRGLTRIRGMPFWTRPPKYALEELFGYFIFKLNASKYRLLDYTPGTDDGRKIIQVAVNELKKMDLLLKSKGFQHKIFITPILSQLQGKTAKDLDIKTALQEANLDVVYLWDELPPNLILKAIFHDEVHLEKQGHALWAELMAKHLSF